VVFDPAQDIGNARQGPDLFLDNHPSPVILDEIQFPKPQGFRSTFCLISGAPTSGRTWSATIASFPLK
jgi:hypothetical protein